jgi:hypothetical protein
VRAEWFQPRSISRRSGERGGDKDLATQRLAQCLYPRDLVDRRADDRKVEAIDNADIVRSGCVVVDQT